MGSVGKIKAILFIVVFSMITMGYSTPDSASDKMPIKIKSLAHKMRILQPRLKQDTAEVYELLIQKYCDKGTYEIMAAILYGESSLHYSSVSPGGDWGLGQINYFTWGKHFNVTQEDLLNPITNIKYSCKILHLTKKAHPEDPHYWGDYHHSKKVFRDQYIKKINSILQKIKD